MPLVGDQLVKPFNGASDAARSIAEAGRQQQEVVNQMAWMLAILAVSVPLALVLFLWLPLRLRWMRRAGVASSVRAEPAGRDLLALRALASQPLDELTKLGPDIAQSWRNGARGPGAQAPGSDRVGSSPMSSSSSSSSCSSIQWRR